MAKHDGFKDFVLDQLADLRGLTCRAMFGGYGLRYRESFFGIIHKGRLYFKVTPETVESYQAMGTKPFRVTSRMTDRKSTRLNSSHVKRSRMPSSA